MIKINRKKCLADIVVKTAGINTKKPIVCQRFATY